MLKATEFVSRKTPVFCQYKLTRNTIFDRNSHLTAGIDGQLKEEVASFVAFLVYIDKSTDITDIAHLAIFIRGVYSSLAITEEFVQLVPMNGMTKAEDILGSLVGTLDNIDVDWSRAVSVASDGATSSTGMKAGVVFKLKEKVHTEMES